MTNTSTFSTSTALLRLTGRSSNNKPEDFKVGCIINTADYKQNLDGRLVPSEKPLIDGGQEFGYICAKHRPMIVMAIYSDKLMCVPLYTHGGKLGKSPRSNIEPLWVIEKRSLANIPPEVPSSRILLVSSGWSKPSLLYPESRYEVSLASQISTKYKGSYPEIISDDMDRFLDAVEFHASMGSRHKYSDHKKKVTGFWEDVEAAEQKKFAARVNAKFTLAPDSQTAQTTRSTYNLGSAGGSGRGGVSSGSRI